MRLDVLAHLGDRALRRDAEHLRVRERGRRIDDRRRAGGHGELRQQLPMALLDHVVHQVLRRRRQHEAGEAVDEHQAEAEGEALAVHPNQPARFFPCARREGFFRRLGRIAGRGRLEGACSVRGAFSVSHGSDHTVGREKRSLHKWAGRAGAACATSESAPR